MKLKKVLTVLFILNCIAIIGFLIINSQFLFIDDADTLLSIIAFNLIFLTLFFFLGVILVSSLQRKINSQAKSIDKLKGQLYDTIKDDEAREKMIKEFEKSLK